LATFLGRSWLRSVRAPIPPDWPEGPAVFAIAHEDALWAAALFRRIPSVALVSLSGDGDLFARILSGGAMRLVRGSSTRGAVPAARALLEHLARGYPVVTALDGPKGPALVPKPGPAWLAAKAGVPLLRLRFSGPRLGRARDWSRLSLPRPFSRPQATLSEYPG
jgi:lysophospholipid acyltransferase (LPLAT)-like uncharacterized protein